MWLHGARSRLVFSGYLFKCVVGAHSGLVVSWLLNLTCGCVAAWCAQQVSGIVGYLFQCVAGTHSRLVFSWLLIPTCVQQVSG